MKRLMLEVGAAVLIALALAAGCSLLCFVFSLVADRPVLELIRQVLLIVGALLLLISGVGLLLRHPFSEVQLRAWESRFQKLPLVYFLMIAGMVFILCGGGIDCVLR